MFKLGDIIVDRVQLGVAESFNDELLYVLTQLADASIEVTAESKDAVDATGTLVKRFWQGKTGTFTANNAMLNLNVLGSMSGEDPEVASEEKKIVMPRIITVKAGTTVTLKNVVEGTIKVNSLSNNGAMGAAYTQSVAASATEFGIASGENDDEVVFTPPTDADETQYIVKYDREVSSGAAIRNKADKFPDTIKLTLKVLAVDPCSADTLRAGYVEMPSFQPSPETSLSLTTDAQLEFKGDLQVNYCSADKELYTFFWADEDEEE